MRSHPGAGGVLRTPLLAPAHGAGSFITGITEFAPGAAIPFHHHNCEESVVLLEGDAALEVDGEEHRLQPLDSTYIPPNVTHRFRNLSATRKAKILWIYGSPHATRTQEATGETHPISGEHPG
jgi:quercetin dioxygenase-like cupin family protein